nr:MAG TPA: hypothetical protein [Caudoviricetes sp.]
MCPIESARSVSRSASYFIIYTHKLQLNLT